MVTSLITVGIPAAFTAFATASYDARLSQNLPRIAFVLQVFAAVLQHDFRQLLFAGRRLLYCDQALLREHEPYRARLTKVPAIL